MSSPIREQRVASSFAVPNPPCFFLSLAPTTSATYPQASDFVGRGSRSSSISSTTSTSSTDSKTGFQFLKLGPCHYGMDLDDKE
ncbi:hypothetical protein ACRALDRAFT_2041580 [Sodiomyces alcalophilus JCM 7366]|uniref:uncharacterized protein n=1 Tax=Sodiomyces alcalophilus JCM 7366 TaxID=591952 RepID=UPI0039B462A0